MRPSLICSGQFPVADSLPDIELADMASQSDCQGELEDWQARFHSSHSYPRTAVTITLPGQKLVAQYESKGKPLVYGMRQTDRESPFPSGADILIGRSLRGVAPILFTYSRHFQVFPDRPCGGISHIRLQRIQRGQEKRKGGLSFR